MKKEICVDGFVILRFHQGQWTVQPTKLFTTYEEALNWSPPIALVGRKAIVLIEATIYDDDYV